jgi:hypothetical protein
MMSDLTLMFSDEVAMRVTQNKNQQSESTCTKIELHHVASRFGDFSFKAYMNMLLLYHDT